MPESVHSNLGLTESSWHWSSLGGYLETRLLEEVREVAGQWESMLVAWKHWAVPDGGAAALLGLNGWALVLLVGHSVLAPEELPSDSA